MTKMTSSEATAGRLEARIRLLRGERVIFDKDLADLYGVSTSALKQAVRRNRARFPSDFMFELSSQEFSNLRSQIVISSWGGTRRAPLAFTEEGVAMLSSVLKSQRAVLANVEIMRAFVRLRAMAAAHEDLAQRLDELEGRYDRQFKGVFEAIRRLMLPPRRKRRSIGFRGP